MAELIEYIEINAERVIIKFDLLPKVTSITNSKFTVATNVATPVSVSNPFYTIDTDNDYSSLSGVLQLSWAADLAADTDYTLTISGLTNGSGVALPTVEVNFTTDSTFADEPLPLEQATPPTVIDYSIISDAFTDLLISTDSLSFQVEEIYPENGDYLLPADFNNGRIIIKFTERPLPEFLSTTYFKVQKKEITRTPSRWENLDVVISLDSEYPWVYIDLPSVDHYPEAATPSEVVVYATEDYEYYSENYKYRIIVSKRITS